LINVLFVTLLLIDPALTQAEAFYENGYFEEAITEYKRYIFFNPNGSETSVAYYKIGLVYQKLHDWVHATNAFRMAMYTAISDSSRYQAELALAVTYIASGNYSAAEITLLKLEMSTLPLHVRQRAAFLRALATMYAKKWKHTQKAFKAYFLSNPDPDLQAEVDSLIQATNDFCYLSPESARQLSALIPGMGQIYAGDWGNGLNSLVLNGSMIYWMAYKIVNRYFGDAWTIYYFLFRRYYSGGIYNAERIAEEHNDALDKKHAERIIELFLTE
jgi:tetratricopeptide (TPR) repeat protein